jgi:hypothetical protein
MDIGIQTAIGQPVKNPLPVSWLGRVDAPPTPPTWARVGKLSATQLTALQAQIAYDMSAWNYNKVGGDNQIGRYQFTAQTLEDYGLLAVGSVKNYGTDAVNRLICWRPTVINNGINVYQNYFYNVANLTDFLNNSTAQEHLTYQYISDLYYALLDINAIREEDNSDTAAGMIYVAWMLGVGEPAGVFPTGTGAWSWRYTNNGLGIDPFNAGRYAVTVLAG